MSCEDEARVEIQKHLSQMNEEDLPEFYKELRKLASQVQAKNELGWLKTLEEFFCDVSEDEPIKNIDAELLDLGLDPVAIEKSIKNLVDSCFKCGWKIAKVWQMPAENCYYEANTWSTDCGQGHYFDDASSPHEHGMKYCPYCGRKIVELKHEANNG